MFKRRSDRVKGELIQNRYRIVTKIGEGSSGITYEAVDTKSNKEVAVKELALDRLKSWKQFELFEREAQTLRALSHPNIPRYLNYLEEGGSYFIVQELARGQTLGDYFRAGNRMDESEVKCVTAELLSTLQYLSSRRPPVVHRDIKPENIVLDGGSGGSVRLVDFGGVQEVLASAVGPDAPIASTIIGTSGYMPPEQYGGAASPASDIYALGAVILFMLSGRSPGQFGSQRLRINWEREVNVGPELRRLLRGMLEPIAEDRITVQKAMAILEGKDVEEETSTSSSYTGWDAARQRPRDSTGSTARLPPQMSGYPGMPQVSRPWRRAPSEAPKGSRAQVTRSDDLLVIDIPPDGLSSNTAFTGAFAVAWNAFVAFWTVSALTGGGVLFALFSLPFWFAGRQLIGQTVLSALLKETFTLDGSNWALTQDLARLNKGTAQFLGANVMAAEGRTRQLVGAKIVTTMIVNGEPKTAIELQDGAETQRFGEGLKTIEQEYIVGQINRHLESLGSSVDIENDLYPSYGTEIVNDRSDIRSDRGFWDDRV